MADRNNILSLDELNALHQGWGELAKGTELVADAVLLLMRQVNAMYDCISYILPPPADFEWHPFGERGVLDADPDLQSDLAKEDTNE